MEIRPYTDFQLEEIMALYASVGWVNYTRRPEMLAAAYQNSLCSFAAFEGEIVGVIRAVGDGASVLLIQDLIVHPAYQRRGVGSLLLRAMLERYKGVYQTLLLTDDTERNAAFYRSLGFSPVEGMGCRAFLKMR